MEYRSIIYKKENGVATIILNRPRALNALNAELIEELLDSVRQAAEDKEVKVLILTGAGRAFSFGADISEFSQVQEKPGKNSTWDLLLKSQEIIRLLSGMPKPTIAALNGFATGLGLDLAMACDLRIAAERAKLGEAFVSMGLIPDGGGTFFLPRLVGFARAAEMIFRGEPLSATEAERIGLINRVVPNQELEKSTKELAGKLAKGPSLAIGLATQVLWKNLQADLDSALKFAAESQKTCLESEDHREAVKAFLEKRNPVFRGK
ncbi:MAG: enoyl-CoA hydratase [Deltaproteobacteria bacterium]|nr:enoyl-CoA hydratase [Deltaproteobacteria bacterium]